MPNETERHEDEAEKMYREILTKLPKEQADGFYAAAMYLIHARAERLLREKQEAKRAGEEKRCVSHASIDG